MKIKTDAIGLVIAYTGIVLQSWWGIWSYYNFGIPFSYFYEFVTSGGGMI